MYLTCWTSLLLLAGLYGPRQGACYKSLRAVPNRHKAEVIKQSISFASSMDVEGGAVVDDLANEGAQSLRSVLDLSFEELVSVVGGSGRAKMLWGMIRQGIDPWGEEDGLTPRSAKALAEAGVLSPAAPAQVIHESTASCGTRKILLRLADGADVETVIIPAEGSKRSRSTVCVSSQIGCERDCQFCMTGTMGLIRNLDAAEILAQVYHAKKICRSHNMPTLTNIVFMGMGEPLKNFNNVKQALEILTHGNQFDFGRSHIVVSTVGPSPQLIRKIAELPALFAWSVHAAADGARRGVVPTTAHPLAALRDAFGAALLAAAARPGGGRGGRGLFVECAMIEGVTDTPELAQSLVDLLLPLPGKTKVNLLPYNDIGHPTYKKSSPERVKAFADQVSLLSGRKIHCTIRTTRGEEEYAACGQLATLESSASKGNKNSNTVF